MTEIIVYRNPLEALMWHAFSSAWFFMLLAAFVVFFAVLLTLDHQLRKIRNVNSAWRFRVSMTVATLCSVGLLFYMSSKV